MKHWCLTFCLVIASLFGSVRSVFALPDCPSSVGYWTQVIFHNCFGTVWNELGQTYVGEWRDGKYHGQGTHFEGFNNYVGEFKDGKRDGHGTEISRTKNGSIPLPRNFAVANFGSLKYGDYPSIYIGEWKNDKYHGQGTLTYEERLSVLYIGEFKDGKMNGHGTYTIGLYGSYQKYIGEFRDNLFNGQGTLSSHGSNHDPTKLPMINYQTSSYIGEFKMSAPLQKKLYIGEFKDGKKHGQGTYIYYDGGKYVGDWRDNKHHGQGTYTYADGRNYVGEFKDGKKHGQGTYTYADGSIIEDGVWKDDEFSYVQSLLVRWLRKFTG